MNANWARISANGVCGCQRPHVARRELVVSPPSRAGAGCSPDCGCKPRPEPGNLGVEFGELPVEGPNRHRAHRPGPSRLQVRDRGDASLPERGYQTDLAQLDGDSRARGVAVEPGEAPPVDELGAVRGLDLGTLPDAA